MTIPNKNKSDDASQKALKDSQNDREKQNEEKVNEVSDLNKSHSNINDLVINSNNEIR